MLSGKIHVQNWDMCLRHLFTITENSLVCMHCSERVSVVKTKKTSDTVFVPLCFNGLVLLIST